VQNKVLIVSPNPPFGGLLQRSLEETGRFRISIADSCVQAAQMMAADACNLALFDIDARDSSLATAFPQFVKDYPDVQMVIFPPDNNLAHPLIAELEDATFLKKPFYLPELLTALDAFIGQQKTPLPPKIHLANGEKEKAPW
jgi:DNA-binding NtrC family response regulator